MRFCALLLCVILECILSYNNFVLAMQLSSVFGRRMSSLPTVNKPYNSTNIGRKYIHPNSVSVLTAAQLNDSAFVPNNAENSTISSNLDIQNDLMDKYLGIPNLSVESAKPYSRLRRKRNNRRRDVSSATRNIKKNLYYSNSNIPVSIHKKTTGNFIVPMNSPSIGNGNAFTENSVSKAQNADKDESHLEYSLDMFPVSDKKREQRPEDQRKEVWKRKQRRESIKKSSSSIKSERKPFHPNYFKGTRKSLSKEEEISGSKKKPSNRRQRNAEFFWQQGALPAQSNSGVGTLGRQQGFSLLQNDLTRGSVSSPVYLLPAEQPDIHYGSVQNVSPGKGKVKLANMYDNQNLLPYSELLSLKDNIDKPNHLQNIQFTAHNENIASYPSLPLTIDKFHSTINTPNNYNSETPSHPFDHKNGDFLSSYKEDPMKFGKYLTQNGIGYHNQNQPQDNNEMKYLYDSPHSVPDDAIYNSIRQYNNEIHPEMYTNTSFTKADNIGASVSSNSYQRNRLGALKHYAKRNEHQPAIKMADEYYRNSEQLYEEYPDTLTIADNNAASDSSNILPRNYLDGLEHYAKRNKEQPIIKMADEYYRNSEELHEEYPDTGSFLDEDGGNNEIEYYSYNRHSIQPEEEYEESNLPTIKKTISRKKPVKISSQIQHYVNRKKAKFQDSQGLELNNPIYRDRDDSPPDNFEENYFSDVRSTLRDMNEDERAHFRTQSNNRNYKRKNYHFYRKPFQRLSVKEKAQVPFHQELYGYDGSFPVSSEQQNVINEYNYDDYDSDSSNVPETNRKKLWQRSQIPVLATSQTPSPKILTTSQTKIDYNVKKGNVNEFQQPEMQTEEECTEETDTTTNITSQEIHKKIIVSAAPHVEKQQTLKQEAKTNINGTTEYAGTICKTDVPCYLNGSWYSETGGILMNVNVFPNLRLNVSILDTPAYYRGNGILSKSWNISGELPFAPRMKSFITLKAINEEEKTFATFIGECFTCESEDVIYGSWMLGRPAHSCRDVHISISEHKDIFRKAHLFDLVNQMNQMNQTRPPCAMRVL